MADGRTGFGGSTPVVQKAGAVRFLERNPRDMFLTGDYNAKTAMYGGNKHEGTMIYSCELRKHSRLEYIQVPIDYIL
jgi:hypothetical protein